MKKKSRLLALLLTLAMVLTYMPALAFADEPDDEGDWGGPDYEFEFVGDEDASHTLYSDGDIQFRLPEDAVVHEGTHFDLTVGVVDWEKDVPDGNMEDRWNKFTEGVEYSFDENSMTLTLYGNKVYDKLGENAWIDFFGGAIPDDEEVDGGWICGGGCEFRVAKAPEYEFEGDRDVLPGWGIYVDKFRNVHADNAQYPNYDENYEITNVTVKNGGDLISESQVEEDGWSFEIKDPNELGDTRGTITLEITYKDIEGKSSSYTFDVNVTNTVYEVYIESEGNIWRTLPGSSINLKANGRKSWIEIKEGDDGERWAEYMESSEDFRYEWDVAPSEIATIEKDKKDSSKAVLRFSDVPVGEDWYSEEANVTVRMFDQKDAPEIERASCADDFHAESDFFQIVPTSINRDMDPGDSVTITPEVRHYEVNKNYSVIDNASFEIEPEGDLEIKKSGSSYVITRTGTEYSWINITANFTHDGNETEMQWDYWVDGKWYDARMNIPDYRAVELNAFKDNVYTFNTSNDLAALIKKDPGSVSIQASVVAANPEYSEDEWDYEYKDDEIVKIPGTVKNASIENGVITVTVDGTKMPEKVKDGRNIEFEVDRVSINLTIKYKGYTLKEDTGLGMPIFVDRSPEAKKRADEEAAKKAAEEEAARKAAAEKAAAEKAAAEQAEWNGVLNKKIPAAKSVKAKAAKKKVTVSWTKANKKNLKKFDTVEIQVCTDKKFNKANTIRKTVKKSKKSLVVKKLTSKKTYYVRVRDVKGSGATKQVSKWSKVKKVKIK